MNLKSIHRCDFLLPLASALSLASSVQAATTVLIEDTFTRSGSIHGSTTDTGQTWTTGSGTASLSTNGSQLVMERNSGGTPRIEGLTFLPNTRYTLSADISVTSTGSESLQFGFLTTTFNSVGLITHRASGFPGAGIELRATAFSSPQEILASRVFPKNLAIHIETGSSLADSIVSWTLNGNFLGVAESASFVGVDKVFVESSTFGVDVGTIDNLRLTATPIPEPASALLAGVSMLGLMLQRRR